MMRLLFAFLVVLLLGCEMRKVSIIDVDNTKIQTADTEAGFIKEYYLLLRKYNRIPQTPTLPQDQLDFISQFPKVLAGSKDEGGIIACFFENPECGFQKSFSNLEKQLFITITTFVPTPTPESTLEVTIKSGYEGITTFANKINSNPKISDIKFNKTNIKTSAGKTVLFDVLEVDGYVIQETSRTHVRNIFVLRPYKGGLIKLNISYALDYKTVNEAAAKQAMQEFADIIEKMQMI